MKCIILLLSLWIGWITPSLGMAAGTPKSSYPQTDSSSAVTALLNEAKAHFENQEFEQAAAKLERALRLNPRNPILWHNLAGVRLKQQDWQRAANLAAKSNAFAVEDKGLRVRNWMIIVWACEGMGDKECVSEARKRAQTLASNTGNN